MIKPQVRPSGESEIPIQALEELAALLLERVGLKIAADGFHGLRLALRARMPASGLTDALEYVRHLKDPQGEADLRSLLPLVTVGKTDFFRDSRQFQALERRILPELIASCRNQKRNLAIWSAGCATGEEPYSLAIALTEAGVSSDEVNLLATDLNPAAIEAAEHGWFPVRRFQGMTEERLRRFFRFVDDGYQVVPSLKEWVHFQTHNLASPIFTIVPGSSVDLILCRNVIIYFDVPTIRAVIDRFYSALRLGGLLVLGYSESLFKVYSKLEMIEVEGSFVYRKPGPAGQPAFDSGAIGRPDVRRLAPPGAGPHPPPKVAPPSSEASPRPTLPAGLLNPPVPSGPLDRLGPIVGWIEKGEFDRARQALERLVADQPEHLEALLTLGNVYSLAGRNAESQEIFARALQQEPLCVEARIFGGVSALQAGAPQEARSQFSKALFLEPELAIGHYLLAQAQEKGGDLDGARKSYRNAIAQLRMPQRPLAGHYPELPDSPEVLARAARYALAALEEL